VGEGARREGVEVEPVTAIDYWDYWGQLADTQGGGSARELAANRDSVAATADDCIKAVKARL